LSSAAPDPARQALRLSRPLGAHPLRWALLLFCLAESLACLLLVRACLLGALGHPQGWQPPHFAGLFLAVLLALAVASAWPGWWRAAGCRLVGLAGRGPGVMVARPDGSRLVAAATGHWSLGGLQFIALDTDPFWLVLPLQAHDSIELALLRRTLRVARKVQPDASGREHR